MTPRDVRRLERATERVRRAEAALDEARAAWAVTVREIGISAVARHLGVTRQAIEARLRRIERRGS